MRTTTKNTTKGPAASENRKGNVNPRNGSRTERRTGIRIRASDGKIGI
jgi:hypothetical protein